MRLDWGPANLTRVHLIHVIAKGGHLSCSFPWGTYIRASLRRVASLVHFHDSSFGTMYVLIKQHLDTLIGRVSIGCASSVSIGCVSGSMYVLIEQYLVTLIKRVSIGCGCGLVVYIP